MHQSLPGMHCPRPPLRCFPAVRVLELGGAGLQQIGCGGAAWLRTTLSPRTMASASPGRAQEQPADGLGMRERAAAIIQVNMALHGEGHQPKAAEQDAGSAALPTAPSLLLPSSRPESRPRSSGQTPILSAKAWAAALRTRLAQRGLNAAAPLCGEVVLPSRGASALRGVEAVAASSDNLSHAGLEPHVRAAAEEMLSQAVTGDLASAVKAADDIALMDRRVALSPMPAARFVFPPDKNTAMHLVRGALLPRQPLTQAVLHPRVIYRLSCSCCRS